MLGPWAPGHPGDAGEYEPGRVSLALMTWVLASSRLLRAVSCVSEELPLPHSSSGEELQRCRADTSNNAGALGGQLCAGYRPPQAPESASSQTNR